MRTRIIVNADDLGADAITNERIIDCFGRRLISSASVMVSMPGFADVVDWYRSLKDKPRLGIHLDLDEGVAVSSAFRDEFGTSKLFYVGGFVRSDAKYVRVMRKELAAQIEKFVASGIPLNHIDSHHHLHNHFPIARIASDLAIKYHVRQVRVSGNVLYPASLHKLAYRWLLNGYLRWKCGSPAAPYFGHLDTFVAARPIVTQAPVELMVHPGKDVDYALLCSEYYEEFLREYDLID